MTETKAGRDGRRVPFTFSSAAVRAPRPRPPVEEVARLLALLERRDRRDGDKLRHRICGTEPACAGPA